MLPVEFEIKTLRTTLELGLDISEAQIEILDHLNALDELRQED